MIERYSYPEMRRIWEDENKFRKWLEIEILACEAWAELGRIPKDAASSIRARAGFEVSRIDEIEKVTNHDVIAFLTAVGERVGEDARFIHLGMTSSDVVDTALSLMMREAADIIIKDIQSVIGLLLEKADLYRHTPMIGRTHGVHAEPVTLGLKFALFASEMKRNLGRMERARETISVGKISGAVGTYANIDPRVEEYVCKKLGLARAEVSTQILQRDRHAEFIATLAIVACSLEKFATEIRNLHRTEIREVEEGFAKGQKGSSAMPHKKNPIMCERIVGLSRVIRGNAVVAMENVALWHERDISHSSAERIIIPDTTILLDYILRKFSSILKDLVVRPENMQANLERGGGLIFSQLVLLALVEKGLGREDAYEIVQRNALSAWEGKGKFRDLIGDDNEIRSVLSPEEIEKCFDLGYHLKHVDKILGRLGI